MLKNILKGMVIGIANIIPGVSGGTMMVSMNIYDKLIHCITHLFSEFKKSVGFLLSIAVGMGIAIIASSFFLEELFAKVPIQTNMGFIGLILGGLPAICKNVKGNKVKVGHILAGLVFFGVVVGLAAMGETEGNAADLTFNFVNVIKLFAVGLVAAGTMVIPGVSGSMMLMLMGYYQPILSTITDFISALVALDMDGILQGLGVLVPAGIGVLAGIFLIAKLIELIFSKFPLYAYWAIIGLIIASPVAIILMNMTVFATINVVSALTGLVALGAGFVVAMKLGE
ncbi:MAG: DUF368 domain-containing protein [Lachnospiraceae bacterium]|nr:DUF368 domain-containing protein [Lachnospiraceae bacterium]